MDFKTFLKRHTRQITAFILTAAGFLLLPSTVWAQLPEDFLSERYIRVAEAGVLADSINVWGDVGSSGRYLVPMGTNLPELISYSYGYAEDRGTGSNINWAKTRIEVKVSRYDQDRRMVDVALFKYKYPEPEPVEMFEFDLQNNDIVTLQVSKRPSFADYVGVIAPVVGVIATSVLLIENLR